MAAQDLSQAEVWDDSALLDSWNEAFEEYKKYHSLAAKGEKVTLKVKQPTSEPQNGTEPAALVTEQHAEVTDDVEPDDQVIAGAPTILPTIDAPQATTMPQVLLSTVQDDALKNIMMSWYYAGYYTGLYEGKQQGYASAMQRQGE